jgi:hypothetical protein
MNACSTLITSAPQSASTAPEAGVYVNWATSTIRTPSMGRRATTTSWFDLAGFAGGLVRMRR